MLSKATTVSKVIVAVMWSDVAVSQQLPVSIVSTMCFSNDVGCHCCNNVVRMVLVPNVATMRSNNDPGSCGLPSS
jgi:hypothetical protein